MDLSKAYDCLSHKLVTAKFEAYGLDVGSLNFLLDYLSLGKHRTKLYLKSIQNLCGRSLSRKSYPTI